MTARRLLKLYLRGNCTLCEEMFSEVMSWQDRLGFRVETVDIDDDEALRRRFDFKVPVLVEGEEEICHHFLDEDVLLAHFGQRV